MSCCNCDEMQKLRDRVKELEESVNDKFKDLEYAVSCLEDKLKDVKAQALYSAKVARQSKHLKK